jgi:hypothetical protein
METPLELVGFGLPQPGRYAAFLFTRIHNFWVLPTTGGILAGGSASPDRSWS